MPAIFLILKRIFPYLKYIGFLIVVAILLFLWWGKRNELSEAQKQFALYQRQVSGQLTDREKQLEEANVALGLSQSKFMEQKDLLKAYEQENVKVNSEFEKFKKDYKIQLESYQKTIAQLEEKLQGGTTVVGTVKPRPSDGTQPNVPSSDHPIDPKTEILSYDWISSDKRFHLSDPDIFVSNNEVFTLNQSFRITGEIYREKAGFLKTQRLAVEEIILDGKNSDGTPKYKVLGTAKIIDSKFNYSEKSPEEFMPHDKWFGAWGVVTANLGIKNLDAIRFTLGTGIEFLQHWGFGLNTQLFLDPKVVADSGFGLGLIYRPTIKDTRLNLGISLSIYTPFSDFGKTYIPSLGLAFYLW